MSERDTLREAAEFLAAIKGSGVQVVGVPEGIHRRCRQTLAAAPKEEEESDG